MTDKNNDTFKTDEGSESAVKRLVSSEITKAVAMSMFVPKRIIEEMVEREKAVSDGKMRAILCGHPDWKNACLSCGKVEIEIGEKECIACSLNLQSWSEKKEQFSGVLRTEHIA